MADVQRVAIIGGGCGAMTAAFELTRPEHQGRFAVTVYQEGWRLGGKGASGRGASGRVEEHGLHIWMGCYENSFRLIRDCYAELAGHPDGSPFGDWREAFVAEPDIGLFAATEREDWQRWSARFPPRPGLPGDPASPAETYSMLGYLRGALSLLQTLLSEVEVSRHGGAERPATTPLWPPDPAVLSDPDRLVGAMRALVDRGVFAGVVMLSEGLTLLSLGLGMLPAGANGAVTRLAETVSAGLRRWLEDNLLADDRHRHVWEIVDLVMATTVGALRFGLLTDPRGLDAIDDYDCREWLLLNGASQRAVDSPFIRGLYDLALAYEDGDSAKPGSAAGNGLRGALRMFFGYRGSLFYRMRAGMGDVVFAPLHAALRRRGVRFEFFHRLTDVGLPPGGVLGPGERTHVTSLTFDVQAEIAGGGEYRPLVEVAGRPCWPAHPDLAQLAGGASLDGVDFESHWERQRAGEKTLTVGEDFDFVVLGVSVAAIPHCAAQLPARSPRWRNMVAEVKTCATQAFQLWLSEDIEQLGWGGPPHIATAFLKPFDTWCDMAHVIPEEAWATPPRTALYFCGVLRDPAAPPADDDTGYPARRRAEVHDSALAFLRGDARHIWPRAHDDRGDFRWTILADAAATLPPPSGPARFETQYWRANVNPSDRYVLSLPGSLKHRISPLDMTFDNMTIAGDWTDCGFNTGCTEAAVMAGRLAAHALSGAPRLEEITGYDHP